MAGPFFILSCARSGSTSIASILNLAENGVCASEPMPNLNVETRDMMDGRLQDPIGVLEQSVFPRVQEGLKNNEVYGEKNLTYGPFIPYLYEKLDCKFVFLKRDGRDVVRSLIDWHNRKFGTIYRECTDPGDLTPTALASTAGLPIHLDTSDYSRPRPQRGEPLYDRWETLSRFEMCAYYWSRINNLYLDQLMALPVEAWVTLDYTSPTSQDILEVTRFLGLKGISEEVISNALSRKINSLKDRGVTDGIGFPRWPAWSSEEINTFNAIAGSTMKHLGYSTQ